MTITNAKIYYSWTIAKTYGQEHKDKKPFACEQISRNLLPRTRIFRCQRGAWSFFKCRRAEILYAAYPTFRSERSTYSLSETHLLGLQCIIRSNGRSKITPGNKHKDINIENWQNSWVLLLQRGYKRCYSLEKMVTPFLTIWSTSRHFTLICLWETS